MSFNSNHKDMCKSQIHQNLHLLTAYKAAQTETNSSKQTILTKKNLFRGSATNLLILSSRTEGRLNKVMYSDIPDDGFKNKYAAVDQQDESDSCGKQQLVTGVMTGKDSKE